MCVTALGMAGGLTAGQALMAGVAMQGLGTMLQMRAEKRAQNARMLLWTQTLPVTEISNKKLH